MRGNQKNLSQIDKVVILLPRNICIFMMQSLEEILLGREAIAREMQELLYEATDPWGVTVERVEVKDVRVPEQLQRAMAAEAEAAREARAKVIAAEGEHILILVS